MTSTRRPPHPHNKEPTIRLLATIPAIITALILSTSSHEATPSSSITHAQQVIRFFDHHPRLATTPAGAHAVLRAAHTLDRAVRSLQSARAARTVFPPHHRLWVCIAWYESRGDWQASNGTHFGGLHMSWDWLGYVNGNAALLSQQEQEWVAERAWAASGYSYSFLVGQWYAWDNAAGCGTTG